MIVTKTVGLSAWGAALFEATRNGGAAGALITGAVAVAFIAIAEHAPTRRWIFNKLTGAKT